MCMGLVGESKRQLMGRFRESRIHQNPRSKRRRSLGAFENKFDLEASWWSHQTSLGAGESKKDGIVMTVSVDNL